MDLYVWSGEPEWGVPAMDIASLQMMTYVKLSNAPVKIHASSNMYEHTLPSMKCSDGVLTDFLSVSAFLRKQNFSCDYQLSRKQCADVLAYDHLLKTKLYPVIMYLWWVEPNSNLDVINTWFYKKMPFPHRLWYLRKLKGEANEFITNLFGSIDNQQDIETELHKEAEECLTLLSNRLGENEFFFGAAPSSIDALIFSYLIVLLKVDVKVRVLQNHIKACPNLCRFVAKILSNYFPLGPESKGPKSSKTSSSSPGASSSVDRFPHAIRNGAIWGTLVGGVLLVYASKAGLIQVDVASSLGQWSKEKIVSDEDFENEEVDIYTSHRY